MSLSIKQIKKVSQRKQSSGHLGSHTQCRKEGDMKEQFGILSDDAGAVWCCSGCTCVGSQSWSLLLQQSYNGLLPSPASQASTRDRGKESPSRKRFRGVFN